MLSGERFIVVDNTASTKWEYENYVKIAKIGGYEIQIREIRCSDEKFVRIFAARNTHNVPVAGVLAMWKRWESDPDAILEDAWMPAAGAAEPTRHDSDKVTPNNRKSTRDHLSPKEKNANVQKIVMRQRMRKRKLKCK